VTRRSNGRDGVPEDFWEAPCPIETRFVHGADEDTAAILLDDLKWAFGAISDQGDAIVSTPATGDVGAWSKPISVVGTGDGTRLTIRRIASDTTSMHRSSYEIRPRVRLATRTIEPGREPPAVKTMRLVLALEKHLRRIVDGSHSCADESHRDRLRCIDAAMRRSGRLLQDQKAYIQLPTPWSGLTVRAVEGLRDTTRQLLTRSEVRAWSTTPMLGALIEGEDRSPRITLGPVTRTIGINPMTPDAMADLRDISSLPRIGRRGLG
jgi:hypothetical protein